MSDCNSQIIMDFATPPTIDDIEALAADLLDGLPDELLSIMENTIIQIEDMADEMVLLDLDVEDSYDLLAWLKKGNEIEPGVEKKNSKDEDILYLYRRPILDYWCETGDDISYIIRQTIIEEIAKSSVYSDDEIEEILNRHYQDRL